MEYQEVLDWFKGLAYLGRFYGLLESLVKQPYRELYSVLLQGRDFLCWSLLCWLLLCRLLPHHCESRHG